MYMYATNNIIIMATEFRIIGKPADTLQVRLKGEHAEKAYVN